MKQISLFYAENVLKMRKMRKSANYVVPHHRILSDALYNTLTNHVNHTLPVPGGPARRIALPAIFLDLINSTTTPAA